MAEVIFNLALLVIVFSLYDFFVPHWKNTTFRALIHYTIIGVLIAMVIKATIYGFVIPLTF